MGAAGNPNQSGTTFRNQHDTENEMNILKRWPYLALLLFVPLLMAPSQDVPEKLIIGNPSWDTQTQSVVVPLAVQSRFVQRGDYFIVSLVQIFDENGDLLAEILSDPHPIVALGTGRNADGLVEIARNSLPGTATAVPTAGPPKSL